MSLDILLQTPIEEITSLKQNEVIAIDSKCSAPHALKILSEKNIYSAPVWDESSKKYLGWIDMMDIVALIVKIIRDSGINTKDIDFYTLLEQDARFSMQHSDAITDLCKNNAFIPVKKGSSLFDALKVLGTHKAHRIPIFENHKIVSILTQSSVIQFLDHHKSSLTGLENQTIETLGLGKKHVITISTEALAFQAYEKMLENKISAIALVDSEGKLVTTITAKDIRIISKHILLTSLFQTAFDFVSECRMDNVFTFSPTISCKLSDTLGSVIAKLAATKIHRIFVVDEAKKPIGVISLSDILEFLTRTKE